MATNNNISESLKKLSKMEKTFEKSQEQAEIIKMIQIPILVLDVEYCREASTEMMNQAHRQESIALLNPNHPQVKNDILRHQGHALRLLCDYVDSLKEIEKLKLQLVKHDEFREQIDRLFL